MKFNELNILGVFEIQPKLYSDERGFFAEIFKDKDFYQHIDSGKFIQENHSGSKKGVLRGLHYQIKNTQGKLVRVVSGEIFDVAVDIRRSSGTFGKWVGINLSAKKMNQLWVPKGFAHGFLVMSDWAEITYKVTDIYSPEHERTITWDDPEIGIKWPIEGQPTLSEKDLMGKRLEISEIFK
jgi:dTDP-4-dehydrorhamnose 3,5-epimerase